MKTVCLDDWQKPKTEELDYFFVGRKSLVTGARGFLGGHLCDELLARQAYVCAIVSGRKPHIFGGKPGSPVQTFSIDLSAGNAVDRVLDVLVSEQVQDIYHLAARATIGKAADNPHATVRDNVIATASLLEACRRAKSVETITVASSDKAYGPRRDLPYRENYAPRGLHIYDASKGAADLIAHSYWFQYGLPVRIIRAGNLYGPGDLNFSRLIPRTVMRFLAGVGPIIRAGQGNVQREWVHVRDAARAYLMVAKSLFESPDDLLPAPEDAMGAPAYNVGGRDVLTTAEIIGLIAEVVGSDLKAKEAPQTSHSHFELPNQFLCDEKLRTETGWHPIIPLRKVLEQCVEWYGNNFQELSQRFGAEIFDGSAPTEVDQGKLYAGPHEPPQRNAAVH